MRAACRVSFPACADPLNTEKESSGIPDARGRPAVKQNWEDAMRISKLMFFFAGALVALVSVWATRAIDANAQAGSSRSGSHVLLAPEDYIEIQQMYSMYSRDVDPGAVRDASWMFADDAVAMISGRKPLTTPEEIQDFYQGVKDRDAGGDRHFNTSYVIVGMPDGTARGSSYMLGLVRRQEGGPIEVETFGKYEDKLVKTSEGWRIKERVWRSDSFRGSMQDVSASPVPGDPRTYATGIEAFLGDRSAR